jgi:hypothetical protein
VRTYGCKMNVHDSERIAGLLDEAGSASVADGAQPDVVVFSTVRENADNRLGGNLGHLKPVKDRTPGMPPLDRFVVAYRSPIGAGLGRDRFGHALVTREPRAAGHLRR